MEIKQEEIYWHYFCISEMLRDLNIDPIFSIAAIYDQIPYGIIKKSVLRRNSTPICDWVMEYLDYFYNDELDKWVLKE